MGLFGSKKKKDFEITVDGMTCNHCKMRVEGIAKEHRGVSKASVDLDQAKLTIEAKEDVDIKGLKAKIKKAGYKPK